MGVRKKLMGISQSRQSGTLRFGYFREDGYYPMTYFSTEKMVTRVKSNGLHDEINSYLTHKKRIKN